MISNIERDMEKCFNNFMISIQKISTGKISPSLLENISIKYYDNVSLLKHISSITVENNNTLKVSVFDRQIIPLICKTILKSNLGINPNVIGNDIKVIFPSLTNERKDFLKKMLHIETEKHKVIIRNIRRMYNDNLKKCVINKETDKNNEIKTRHLIQKVTDKYIKKIHEVFINKENEISKF